MEAADYEVLSVREQLFHERVRECIISTLLFATLYILCHITLTHFKKPAEFTTVDDEDATVNKIALELCTFTLAVALGAVLLLPFSIISNEVLLSLPRNYYIQWLNGSLIHGLWNLVFLFSNLSLIFLMPFAYFFTESEGFAGSRKGVLGRVYETVVMLMLLTLLVLGMVWVASAIVDNNKTSRESLYDFWEYYLPYLYSCISFLGVLLLLVCTPLGLARMFSVTGKLLVKPRVLEDLEEQLYCSAFEEAALTRRICSELQFFPGGMIGMHWARAAPSSLPSDPTSCWLPLDMELLHRQVLALQTQRVLLEKRWKASAWQRNLGYPLAMLCLLLLTGLSVLIVAIHILELLIDEAAMPRGMQDASLGQVSFSKLGSFGAVIQVVLIFYLMVSSIVGFYSSPLFRGLRPRWHDTAMTQIIGNCVCLLVLSSALPVFSRTLGLTRFDLLGDFGRFNWLGNFYIVFLYNAIFAGLTTLCLVKTFTAAVRAELIRAFGLDRLPLPVSGFPRASRKTQHQ
ncbi:PREDICTED: protein LMBR1L isoform X4 [Myotis davidii]|uniref:Limb development membrane protein 1 like n=1 Tax=Myotis myotis TaxID=51298 RepID=A0A7J7Z3Z5_MYOMY|nr:PREDICTED: protein LMBR1L isoform X4 [Myotis davidii]XP_036155662.1 protein LMBR1L isoform X2 [Myotis myotis]KAF6368952.1 limb development membrane protein 1 like [Myotis myotis]